MKKNLALVLAVIAVTVMILFTVDFQSVDEYYLTHLEDITSDSETVTLSVTCGTVLDNYDSLKESLKYSGTVPADGVILSETEYVLRDGDTVFDILNRALQYNKIHFDYSGSPNSPSETVYIKGINNIYEYDCGDLSGWMYCVNGEFPQYSCSEYRLSDGDTVEWMYTCDLGRDVGDVYYGGNQSE